MTSFLSRNCLWMARFSAGVPGTKVMKRLIGEANELNLAMRLNVVRINPARWFCERFGFRVASR